MGQRGPKPTPTKLLKLRGSNRGKYRSSEPEPSTKGFELEPPAHLRETGRAEWLKVVPELLRLKLLTVLDRQALICYCEAVDTYRAAMDWIKEHGTTYVVRDKDGREKLMQVVPQVSIARNARTALRQFAHEFGLTPSARVGLPSKTADTAADAAPTPFIKTMG